MIVNLNYRYRNIRASWHINQADTNHLPLRQHVGRYRKLPHRNLIIATSQLFYVCYEQNNGTDRLRRWLVPQPCSAVLREAI